MLGAGSPCLRPKPGFQINLLVQWSLKPKRQFTTNLRAVGLKMRKAANLRAVWLKAKTDGSSCVQLEAPFEQWDLKLKLRMKNTSDRRAVRVKDGFRQLPSLSQLLPLILGPKPS